MNTLISEIEPKIASLTRIECEEIFEENLETPISSLPIKITQRMSGRDTVTLTLWGDNESEVERWGWSFGVFGDIWGRSQVKENIGNFWGNYSLSFTHSIQSIRESLITIFLFRVLNEKSGVYKGIKGGIMNEVRKMVDNEISSWEFFNPF